jgi:hypothetical protein
LAGNSAGRVPLAAIITLGLVMIVVILAIRGVLKNQSALFEKKLEAILQEELGRAVDVRGASLGFPLRVDEIIVAGDGVIDSSPIFVFRGASAWPDIFSIIRFEPALGAVTFESAIVSVTESADGSWSTQGLLPKPPVAAPAIRLLHMPDLELRVRARGQTVSQRMKGTLQLRSYGGFVLAVTNPSTRARIEFTGVKAARTLYSFQLEVDSAPSPAGREDVRCSVTFNPGTRNLSFKVASRILAQPVEFRGEVAFETHAVRCDTGAWTYGSHTGRFRARYDDRLRDAFFLETIGRVDLPASLLAPDLRSGIVSLTRLVGSGAAGGPIAIDVELDAKNLKTASGAAASFRVDGLSLRGTVSATWSRAEALALQNARIDARFDLLAAAGHTLRNGNFRIDGGENQVTIDGRASGMGGTIEADGLAIRLGDGLRPVSAEGRVIGRALDLSPLRIGGGDVKVLSASGAWALAASAHGKNGEWGLTRIEGTLDRAGFTWRGQAGTLERGRVALTSSNGWMGTVKGRLEICGGGGTIHAYLRDAGFESAAFELGGLRVRDVEKLLPGAATRRLVDHAETIGGEGVLAVLPHPSRRPESMRTGVEKGWKFDGTLRSTDFRFKANATGSERAHEIRCEVEAYIPEADGPIDLAKGTLSIDRNRTRLSLPRTRIEAGGIQSRITIHALDARHLREAAALYAPERPVSRVDLSGALKGWVDLNWSGDSYAAELDLEGDLDLVNSPLTLHAFGNVSDREPNLIFDLKTVSLPAILNAAADYDSRVDRDMMKLEGTGGAWLTVIGSSWSDLSIDGLLKMRNANIDFPAYNFGLAGVTGELPFRLQRAQKLELTPMDSSMARELRIHRIRHKDLFATDLKGMARFNEKTLVYENVAFEFAESRGRGAFAIDFPTWDQPRTAFFGEITGCSVGIVYRTMQPFAGRLEGTGDCRLELKTEGPDLTHVLVRIKIKDGILGSELLRGVVSEMEQSVAKDALMSITEWDFAEADLKFDYDRNYYSPTVARNKFGDSSRRYEVLGNISVTGPIYPFDSFRILNRIRPFNFIGINVELKIESAQMRLLMDRVGKRAAAP